MAEYQIHQLKNGIRLVHQNLSKANNGQVAHLGLIIDSGSRDEFPHQNGLAHFIEHLIFKGTEKRKAYHILSRLEDIGGELNAYTSKEETVIQAAFLSQHYARALELFADIVFHSVFPEKELKKEKEVVIDEINSYKDSPSEQIFDDFDCLLFPEHPLGKNILGTKKLVKTFNRKLVKEFIEQNYNTDKMIISSVGAIEFPKLVRLFEKYFADKSENISSSTREAVNSYVPIDQIKKRRLFQAHCMIGNRAYSLKDEKRTAFSLLNNYLGGPGLNSRLNLAIREKYGFTYNLESNFTPFTDVGNFSVYMGTDKNYLDRSIELVNKELQILRDKKLGPLQLKKAKQQFAGQIAISEESNAVKMHNNGRSLLSYGRISTLEEVHLKIHKVSAEAILEVANEIFDPNQMSMLVFK
ncbi:MAG: pitrilysin family protein [Bacteroidales bacterium]|jgi:predicted Zn-dependent peptidase|nr:pitrilysin family protein [Bacteroidales bacterium]